MMNISPLPNASPQDLHGLFALLALLKDPEIYERRLTEIISEKQQAMQAFHDSQALLSEARAATDTIEAARVEMARREAALANAVRDHEAAASRLADDTAALASARAAHESEISARHAALDERAKQVEADECASLARAEQTKADAAAAAALKSSWEQKVSRVKAAIHED